MHQRETAFDEDHVIHLLQHYLPAQAPLKDFVHHNTLHAFQDEKFEIAIRNASKIFGFKTSLSILEFRELYKVGKIQEDALIYVIEKRQGHGVYQEWKEKLIDTDYSNDFIPKVGQLRKLWKSTYHIDLDTIVHTNLFRILNSYLDQGIAITKFPITNQNFIDAIRIIEKNSWVSFFKTKRAKDLLFDESIKITDLLELLVGDTNLYEQYLFDQQFAHPGWSGLVSTIESQPQSILDSRKIDLKSLIHIELLLEIDNLEKTIGEKWQPLYAHTGVHAIHILSENQFTEYDEVLTIWQQAYEWSYFDQVLAGIKYQSRNQKEAKNPSFQAFFCIDDRECSLRRHIENFDPKCDTYATAGHFAVDSFYQPKNAKFYTKVCPAPVNPKHLIKEVTTQRKNDADAHFRKTTHSLFRGWLITQTLGFWSAIRLMFNIFKPSFSPAFSSSFGHMHEHSTITVENRSPDHKVDGLQVGYSIDEMVSRVEAVLKSTGLVTGFAPLVYVIGHGASSANNTHYAGYDCGACSGRPGSANARAFSYMANHKHVRAILKEKGIDVPIATEFIGGLHDTTRDEIYFYDEELLSPNNTELHRHNVLVFEKALRANAKERSRRFMSINTKSSAEKVHKEVKKRSVSLFEPRPELNHATNALCIVGRRSLSQHLMLDRRSFLNSYDYAVDPDGKYLQGIVNAAAPVCGGINLEYFFSRVDNERLGAGSKLPHNVMGLIGVANGFEGDLRPGLPSQMIEVHDPIRLMIIIEQYPNVVLDAIKASSNTYEWFINEWVLLSVAHPDTNEIYHFKDGDFNIYEPLKKSIDTMVHDEFNDLIESSHTDLPVVELI
jgi:uncharacterized protein